MKKRLKLILIIVACVISLMILAALGGIIMIKSGLEDYFEHSTSFFPIPDISKGFIPQGITYDQETRSFFITGYMDNGKNSPIYAIDQDGRLVSKVLMLTETGEKFRGHAGGISVHGDQLYVAGSTDACMYSFSIQEILGTKNQGASGQTGDGLVSLKATKRIPLKTEDDFIRVSFTSFDEELLYAGEFRKDPIFYTHDSHYVTIEDGKQKAYLFGFDFDENGEVVPTKVYSIPDNVQGACFDEEYVYLSQSHGFMPSEILTYRLEELEVAETRKVLGKEIPLYVLTEKNAKKVTKVPPMSEEIVTFDNKMYILHEAASNRYLIGKLLGQDQVYSTPITYFR